MTLINIRRPRLGLLSFRYALSSREYERGTIGARKGNPQVNSLAKKGNQQVNRVLLLPSFIYFLKILKSTKKHN